MKDAGGAVCGLVRGNERGWTLSLMITALASTENSLHHKLPSTDVMMLELHAELRCLQVPEFHLFILLRVN